VFIIRLAPAAESAKFFFRPFTLRLCRKAALLALAFTAAHLAAQNATTTTAFQPTASVGIYDLEANVTSNNPAAGSISGQVNFTDQTTGLLLGTATLSASGNLTGTFGVTASNTLPGTDTCVQPIRQVIAVDADGDGKLDLVMEDTLSCISASNSTLANILVARGNEDGTFSAPISLALPLPSASAISTGAAGGIATGNFGSRTGLPGYVLVTSSEIVTLPDINSPFNTNIVPISSPNGAVYVSPDSSWIAVGTISGFNVYNNNAGTLTLANSFPINFGASVITATKYGLAIGSCTLNPMNSIPFTGVITLFTGTTAASLQQSTSYSTSAGCISGIVAGSFRGSAYNDILFVANPQVSTNTTSELMALDDDGNGNYTQLQLPLEPISNLSTATTTGTLIAADLNNDGKLDVAAITNISGSLAESAANIYYGDGNGGFRAGTGAVASPNPDSIVFGNFTPGVPGIATSSATGSSYTVAQVLPTFATASTFISGLHTQITGGPDQVVATYVGDGNYASSTSPAVPLYALPIPTTLRLIPNATTLVAGQTLTVNALLSPYSIPGATTDFATITYSGAPSSGVITQLLSGRGQTTFRVAAGTYTITASFASTGSTRGVFASATSAPITINVLSAAPTSTPTTLILTGNPAAPTPGQSTILTATLSPYSITGGTTDGELVTFRIGNVAIGTARLTSGVAILTTAALPAGTDTFSAVYPGDIYFATSTYALTVTVAAPPSTIAVTPASNSLTIPSPGGSASTTLSFASKGGFTGTVALTCAVTYTGTGSATAPPTCSLNPSSVSVSNGGTATSTLTINTTASTSALNTSLGRTTFALAGSFAGALLLLLAPRRRKSLLHLACLLVLATFGALAGCSGGGNSNPTTTNNTTPTTLGSYNVAITATSGSVTTTTNLPLTVQ
jgi:hypothetical protein